MEIDGLDCAQRPSGVDMRLRPFISLAILSAVASLAPTARAQAPASVCVDGTTSSATGRGACSSHGGVDAKATAAAKKTASTVTCADGSTSKAGRGACSRHGGIKSGNATAAPPAPAAASPTATLSKTTAGTKAAPKKGGNDDPTDATAQCKDGTYSHAKTHRGACSRHGGVAKFIK
jgi:hypothetical protein